MKTKTTNRSGLFKSTFLKVLLVTAFFALAWTSKSKAQTIVFAKVEYANWQMHSASGQVYYTADVYLRYYSDYWCTSQASCPITADLTLTQSYFDTYSGNAGNPNYGSLTFTATVNETETLVQQGAIMQIENSWNDYYYESRYYYWDNFNGDGGSVYMGAWDY